MLLTPWFDIQVFVENHSQASPSLAKDLSPVRPAGSSELNLVGFREFDYIEVLRNSVIRRGICFSSSSVGCLRFQAAMGLIHPRKIDRGWQLLCETKHSQRDMVTSSRVD